MHLNSLSSQNYTFANPLVARKPLLSAIGFEQLLWVQSHEYASDPATHHNFNKKLVAYDFSTPVDKTLDFSRSLFNRFSFSLNTLKTPIKFIKPKYQLATILLGLATLVLPSAYYLQNLAATQLPAPAIITPAIPVIPTSPFATITPHVLTVATVKASGTYFADDKAGFSYEHGFGYDVVRNYANQLGDEVAIAVYNTPEEALQAVATGRADMALTSLNASQKAYFQATNPIPQRSSFASVIPAAFNNASNSQSIQTPSQTLKALSISCNKDFLQKNGLDKYLSLAVPANNSALAQNASEFLCDGKNLALNEKLAGFYTQNVLKDDYSQQHFKEAMSENLPMFQYSFKQSAKAYDHDWQLLVAMSYQESHLEANATSPTGVQGIMMLTNDTAKAMGVTDRIDPVQSIQGGAKYLNQLNQQFSDINESDRVWFMLASYNMGPMAVKNIQNTLSEQGKNPNSWAEVYRYMAENTDKNRRYGQCMDYVTNIRGYLEQIKLSNEAKSNSPTKSATPILQASNAQSVLKTA